MAAIVLAAAATSTAEVAHEIFHVVVRVIKIELIERVRHATTTWAAAGTGSS